jgi:hypothetical protein
MRGLSLLVELLILLGIILIAAEDVDPNFDTRARLRPLPLQNFPIFRSDISGIATTRQLTTMPRRQLHLSLAPRLSGSKSVSHDHE